jgi:hypothetical protein
MKSTSITALVCGPVLIGIAAFGLLFFASAGALDREVPAATARVADAFQRGQLVVNPFQHPSTTIGSHQWNDCLILLMAVDQRGDRTRLALSPIIAGFPGLAEADENPCLALKALVSGVTPDPDLYYYDRYVHGAVPVLRYLLPHFEVEQIRRLYRALLSAVLILGLALCLIGVARGNLVPAFAALAVVFLALLRFFGLEFFSQSLGHGPADILIGCYALAIAVMLLLPTRPFAAVATAAVFGALTVVFELFTGGVPIGVAMVLGLSSLPVRRDTPPQGVRLATWAAMAFMSAAITVYLLKLLAVVSISDAGAAVDVVERLRHYSLAADTGLDLVAISRQVADSVGVLVGGMALVGWAAVVGGVVAGAYGANWIRRHVPDSATRQQGALLLSSMAPVPIWLALFPNQVESHAWYMDRILVWPVAAGFALFVLAMAERSRSSHE